MIVTEPKMVRADSDPVPCSASSYFVLFILLGVAGPDGSFHKQAVSDERHKQ